MAEQPVYDAMLKLLPQNEGWGTSGAVGSEGLIPELMSESMSRNEQMKERDARIVAGRFIKASMITKEQDQPAGDIVMAPRIADLPLALMMAFQCRHFDGTSTATGTGTNALATHAGTLTFVPIDHPVDWDGSVWGTISHGTDGCNGTITSGDVYAITCARAFRSLTGSNVEYYIDTIADVLTFTQAYNEDLQLTLGNKTASFSEAHITAAAFDTALGKAPALTKNYFSDWNGTFTVDGTVYDFQSWSVSLNNNCADRGRLGKLGFSKFPFGRPMAEGALESILSDGIELWKAGGTAKFEVTYKTTDGWLEVILPRIVYRARDYVLPGGEEWVARSMPYRAVPGSNGTPAMIVRVFGTWSGSYYADSLFSQGY